MTIIWCMVPQIWSMTDRIFCHSGPSFAIFPLNQPKKSRFWKMKRKPGDILILYKCIINDNHMMYGSWDMVRNGCHFYFLFWAIFCPFTSLTAQKFKIGKQWKKALKISSFYNSDTKNHVHMLYCSWHMARDGCNYFSFWTIFCTFTPLTAQKIKIEIKWRKPWWYHHFTLVYKKSWSYAILFLRYGVWQM